MPRRHVETLTRVILFCVVAGILVVVLLPADALGDRNGRIRSLSEAQSWLVHGALFATLGLAVGLRLAAPRPSRLTATWVIASAVLMIAFAIVSELAQIGVSGRNAAVGDWLADLVGTALGLSLAAMIGPPTIDWLTTADGD